MRSLIALALLGLSGCSGLLIIEADEAASTLGCVTSSVCGIGLVCVDDQCVDSPGRCSLSEPDGDCPIGRVCDGGVCRDAEGTVPPAPDEPCDETEPTGACEEGAVCVAGDCVVIREGVNDCSEERPTGLCPPGGFCAGGVCLAIDDGPCSATNPAGGCPAGESCVDGSCAVALCSDENPFGVCPTGEVCLEGICRPETVILTCEEREAVATCASQNRGACTEAEDGTSSCGECLDGFRVTDAGQCVAETCLDLACSDVLRVCDDSGFPVTCGACIAEYFDSDGTCTPNTCAQLDCAALNRRCSENDAATPASCDDCVDANFVDTGTDACVLRTCAIEGATCEGLNRECVEGNLVDTAATCGDCVAPTTEVGGLCVECSESAECAAGSFCDLSSRLCTTECTTANDCGDPASAFECSPGGRCARLTPDPGQDVCGTGVADEGELVRPVVYLVLDRSSSMNNNIAFPTENPGETESISRWDAVGRVLFGGAGVGEGLITELQNDIHFNILTYNRASELQLIYSQDPFDGDGAAVLPPLGNRDALLSSFQGQSPAGGTPSFEGLIDATNALLRLREQLEADEEPVPPMFIVHATDGRPESSVCTDAPNTVGEWGVNDAAFRAAEKGIKTFVLAVGGAVERNHLQDSANAGAGVPPLVPLDYETFTTCFDRTGDRVNAPLTTLLSDYPDIATDFPAFHALFSSLPDVTDGDGNPGNAVCRNDRMGDRTSNLGCVSERYANTEPELYSYEEVYGVVPCSSAEDIDQNDDGTPEMAACYFGRTGRSETPARGNQ
ncbi:MAG: vWA domain-containing protein [Myxococcota bacterium]